MFVPTYIFPASNFADYNPKIQITQQINVLYVRY